MKIKNLKQGDLLTLICSPEPKESIVWVRGHYDQGTKRYSIHKWSDTNKERFVSGDTEVFTDFTF